MEELKYNKICISCKKEYKSNARGQRYCSPECGKKYNRRLKENRKFYDENKQLMRLKARTHALAVEIKKFEYHKRGLDFCCEICGDLANEVHHINLNFFDNSLKNLKVLCTSCHAKMHSELIKNVTDKVELYDPEFYNLVKDILK